jgi:hypothetical protein
MRSNIDLIRASASCGFGDLVVSAGTALGVAGDGVT